MKDLSNSAPLSKAVLEKLNSLEIIINQFAKMGPNTLWPVSEIFTIIDETKRLVTGTPIIPTVEEPKMASALSKPKHRQCRHGVRADTCINCEMTRLKLAELHHTPEEIAAHYTPPYFSNHTFHSGLSGGCSICGKSQIEHRVE